MGVSLGAAKTAVVPAFASQSYTRRKCLGATSDVLRVLIPQKSADVRDSAGHGAKTAAVRAGAILALLSERTIGKAAAKSGVNEKTLRRWLSEDEAFKAAYAAARQAAFQVGIGRMQALAGRAVDTLEELLGAKKYPSVRLGAARAAVDLAIHQNDAETIMRRLDEIETYQRQQDTAGRR